MSIFGLITTTFNIVSEIRISEREIKDFSNLQDSKNILIFTETNQRLDDNLLPIC